MAKLDISQLAFDERLKIDFGAFGSSQQDEKIFDIQALSYSTAAMNPTLPFHKTGNGWQRNGNASQIGPTEPLLFERNDEKNLTFNSHLQLSLQLTHNLHLAVLRFLLLHLNGERTICSDMGMGAKKKRISI